MIALSIVIANARVFPRILVGQLAEQVFGRDEILVVRNRPPVSGAWVGTDKSCTSEHRPPNKISYSCSHAPEKLSSSLRYRGNTFLIASASGGVSVARNVGWRSARNEWILFLDDDVTISRSFLSKVRERLVERGFPGVMTFRVHSIASVKWSGVRAIISLDRGPELRHTVPPAALALHEVWQYGVGAAMLVSSDVLRDTGGFKPGLGAGRRNGGAEDLEFLWHASRHTTVDYAGDIVVRHRDVCSLRDIGRKFREYGRAIASLAGTAKHVDGLRTVVNYCSHLTSATSSKRLAGLPRQTLLWMRAAVALAVAETGWVYTHSLVCRARSGVLCAGCW